MKIQAPAVHSAKLATKEALKMKSFMEEKIAAGQLQAQKVQQYHLDKAEERQKAQEDKNTKEQKINQKVSKDNKEKATSSLAGLLGKSV
jgi:type II secretory pathway component PulF